MSRYSGPNPGAATRRTFTAERLAASRLAWDAGRFSPEWREWRHLAAMRCGIVDPPAGTRWDSWADADPSERAILVRAIRETPAALRAALLSGRCHTWAQVVREVLVGRDRMADEADRRERGWEATRRAPMAAASDVLGVVADSLGLPR